MVRATACIIRSWRSSPPNPTEQEDKDLLGAHPQNNSAVCGQEQDHEEDYQREKSVEPGDHSLPELHLLGEGLVGRACCRIPL